MFVPTKNMKLSPSRLVNIDKEFGYKMINGILYHQVACGHCIACRKNRAIDWSIRMMYEKECWDNAIFITLTFDNEHLPKDLSIHVSDLQNFNKRLREQFYRDYGYRLNMKFYGCGEYGGKFGRPHYHEIIFGLGRNKTVEKLIKKAWPFGFVYIGDVSHQSCQYVAQYCMKKLYGKESNYYDEKGIEPEFSLCSKGLGEKYCKEHANVFKRDLFTLYKTASGKLIHHPLPRYFVNKLFEEDEAKANYKKIRKNFVENERRKLKSELKTDDFGVDDYLAKARAQKELNLTKINKLFRKE